MELQFRCTDDRRRQLVATSTRVVTSDGLELNGIDYLEVVDHDATDPADRQRILHLYFLKPDGVNRIAGEEIVVSGGVRVTAIAVTSVAPLTGSDRALEVHLSTYGDFSTYTLQLIGPDGQTPPRNMDPVLSQVAFSFKIDCPSPFDCAAADECPPTPSTSPPLDYLAKDYTSFQTLMLDRMAATIPAWTERSPVDLGVTLVELLADAADRLSYFQDATATEAYLATARRRTSVRRHARLTGYRLSEGSNARCFVVFEVSADVIPTDASGTPVPALMQGTLLLSPQAGNAVSVVQPPDDADTVPALAAASATWFETLAPLRDLRTARNGTAFHTWGDERCCLARGATSAFLVGTAAQLDLRVGDVLVLEEVQRPDGAPGEPPDPAHRHPVRLIAPPIGTTDPLDGTDVLQIKWHPDDALPFPLALYLVAGAGRTAVVRGNVVAVDHGWRQTLPAGALNPPAAPAAGPWRPTVTLASPITFAPPFTPDASDGSPASAAALLASPPDQAVAQMTLTIPGDTWQALPDLLGSDGFEPAFVVESEAGEPPALRFGDGVFGRAPPPGLAAAVSCRQGTGRAGNVGAEAIGHLVVRVGPVRDWLASQARAGLLNVPDPLALGGSIAADLDAAVGRVRNPQAASGGVDPDPLVKAKLEAPQAFRRQDRAVTAADYAAAVQKFPGVDRALAERRWVGSWHVIYITVDRAGGAAVDEAFQLDLLRFLEPLRLAGHDLQIVPPQLVPLDIAIVVCVAPDHVAADVQLALLDRFGSGVSADGTPAYFNPDRLTFGMPVYLGPILAQAMAVPGVVWAGLSLPGGPVGYFRKLWQPAIDWADAGAIPVGRLEIAVLDNDPNRPERGRFQVLTEGGL